MNAAAAAAAAAAAGAAALREQEAANDEGVAAEVWGRGHGPVETRAGEITLRTGWCAPAEVVEAERARQHAADDEAAALADNPADDEEEVPDWARDERGLTYRELLIVLAEELRFASPEALDAPVRVHLGDSVDGIQSVLYDPDAGRLVMNPWLTRGVPRAALPAPGLHDFLIRHPHEAGAALRVIRSRRGVERPGLTALTGVAASNLGNIERGVHRPSIDMLVKLTQALRTGIEIRDLRDDKPDRPDFTVTHPTQVGPVMRAMRLRRGVLVETVATQAELRPRMLRQYEDGVTMPNLVTLLRVLDVLDAVLALSDLDRRGDAP